MLKYDSNLKIFFSDKINNSRFFSGFGTKQIGDATNIANILNYFSSIGLKYKKLIILEQIHSVNLVFVAGDWDKRIEKIEETDGVITKESDVILTVRTADCAPIIFCDKNKGIIGISHNGWRGSLKRFVQKMVEKMVEYGAKKKDLVVVIGPSIGSCCYDIDLDRYFDFMEEFNGYADKIFQIRHGKKYVSLSRLNYLLLLDAGIPAENIDFFPFCTSCDKTRFFSFRRDAKKNYGEMLSFIVQKEQGSRSI